MQPHHDDVMNQGSLEHTPRAPWRPLVTVWDTYMQPEVQCLVCIDVDIDFITQRPLPILRSSMRNGNSTWHWQVWSIGVAGENARFAVFMGRSKQSEANRRQFFVTSTVWWHRALCQNTYLLKFGNFCAYDNNDDNNNDNDDRTDYFTPCACARGNNLF